MENVCSDSPMFDFVEEAAGKEVRAFISGPAVERQTQSQEVASTSDAATRDKKNSDAEKLATFAA